MSITRHDLREYLISEILKGLGEHKDRGMAMAWLSKLSAKELGAIAFMPSSVRFHVTLTEGATNINILNELTIEDNEIVEENIEQI